MRLTAQTTRRGASGGDAARRPTATGQSTVRDDLDDAFDLPESPVLSRGAGTPVAQVSLSPDCWWPSVQRRKNGGDCPPTISRWVFITAPSLSRAVSFHQDFFLVSPFPDLCKHFFRLVDSLPFNTFATNVTHFVRVLLFVFSISAENMPC